MFCNFRGLTASTCESICQPEARSFHLLIVCFSYFSTVLRPPNEHVFSPRHHDSTPCIRHWSLSLSLAKEERRAHRGRARSVTRVCEITFLAEVYVPFTTGPVWVPPSCVLAREGALCEAELHDCIHTSVLVCL